MSRDTGGSVRGGVLWSLLAFLGAKSLTFLSTLVLARLVAPADFGVLAAVLAYIAILELASDLGMKATVVFQSEEGITPRVETAFTLNAALAAVLALLAVLAAPLVAALFAVSEHTDLFRLAALQLLLTGLGNVHDALLLRAMDFRRRLVPQLAMNAVRAATTITLAAVGLGVTGLVVGFVAGTAVWTVVLWAITGFRPRWTVERAAVRGMVTYGGWSSVLGVLAAIGSRADVVVVGRLLGPQALGYYTIAQRLPELVIENVSWNLSAVGFPALARRRDRHARGLAPTTLDLIRYGALYGVPAGAAIAVLSPSLVPVLFGEAWAPAAPALAALAVMYGLHTLVFPFGDALKAVGRQPVMAAVNAVTIPAMILAMVLASPAGLAAVAWARVGVSVVNGIVLGVIGARMLGLSGGAVLGALRPAAGAGAGAALGAAVAAASVGGDVPVVLLGAVGAAAGAVTGLRLAAPGACTELVEVVRGGVRPAPRGAA